MFFAISAALVLIVVVLLLLTHKMKLPYEHRMLHIRSIIVAAVLSVAAVRSFVPILDLLDRILGNAIIQRLLFRIMPQTNISATFFWIITLLSCIIVSAGCCIVFALVYNLWLKRLAKSSYLHKKNPVTKILNWLSCRFYVIEAVPRVKNSWVNVGHWLRVMRNMFASLLILEALSVSLYIQFDLNWINDMDFARAIKSLYMVPVISWLVLDQIVIFLQADPGSEDINLETEENKLSHYGDYKKLIAVYDDLFSGQALISTYVNEEATEQSMFSGPTEDQKKRCEDPELLEAVCRSINNLINPLPSNFIDSLIDLLNGKSVAVFDTISGEFHLFYLAFLQRELLLRRKALVICDTEDQIGNIILQFKDIFKRLNKSHEIWQINDIDSLLTKDNNDTDILVCTEEQLLENNIGEKFPEYYKYLHNVLVMYAYDIMCRSESFAFRFFEALRKKNVQFAFLVPENSRDMDSALEIRLDGLDIRLYNNFNEKAGACILCWRGESYYKTQQAFSLDLYNDFGLAYTIALIAMKNGVAKVYIHSPSDVPFVSNTAAVKYSISTIAKHYLAVDSVSLDSVVIHNPIAAFRPRELSFDIFYDEYNNLLNVVMQALTNCAEITSMVHIISRPYMLRDYFAYHLNAINHNEWGMQLIVPVYYQDLKAPSVALLIHLREKGMLIEDVIRYMEGFGVKGKNVEELLRIAVCSAFETDSFSTIYSYFSFGKGEIPLFYDNEYHYSRVIRLTDESLYNKLCEFTEDNIVIVGDHHEVLPVSRHCVYDRFLKGQCHSFGGERYRILSVSDGKVNVSSEESVERENEYTHIYDLPVAMLADKPEYSWEQNSHYSRDLFRIRVTRSVRGYFSHINGLDFYGDNTKRFELSEAVVETKDTHCLRIRLFFAFNSNHDTAAAMLVLLMRGILETALPKNYKDILVLSRLGEDAFDESLFDDAPKNAIRRDPMPSDWLESKDNELPLSQSLKELFPRIADTNIEYNSKDRLDLYLLDASGNGNHLLAGIAEDCERLFNVLYGYLDWVIKNPKLEHCYLRFGYRQIPGIFNLTAVYSCLQRIANYLPDVSGSLNGKLTTFDLSDSSHCSFCGRSIAVSSWKFDDERIMCEECYEHRTTERREIQVLLKRAYETLEKNYRITLPKGIKIRFKSATSIKKAGSTVSGGRVLGFFNASHREIWVERGGPEPCVLSTLMHELTHAWQYANIDVDKLDKKYIEGHATYVEIECTRILGQRVYADYWERSVLSVSDEYSQGLRYWKERIKVEPDKNIFNHIRQM